MRETIIVRLPNWLGDTVMAVPAIRSLRGMLPEAHLVLAGPWVSVLTGQDLADVLAVYPRSWKGRLQSADAIREFRADTAVLLPNSFEAAAAALYWGARRRVGFACGARTPLLTERVPFPAPRRHQIDEYLVLMERLGVRTSTRVPELVPPDPASDVRRRARDLLAEARVPPHDGGRRRVGIHLGAAYGSAKVWPAQRVIELCHLLREDGDTPVLLGPAEEAPAASSVLGSTSAVSLIGRDSPDLLPGLLSELDVLISGDTGVAHLAAALGTPVVALFGPTDPRLTAPRGGAIVVQHTVRCAPCFYRRCPIEHPCMMGIDAGEVRAQLRARSAGSR